MKARYLLTASALALIIAAPASASVISASSQTARSKPADRVDYLSVTSLQNDLNASFREAADASSPPLLDTRSTLSTTSGGFFVGGEDPSADRPAEYQHGGDPMKHLFDPEGGSHVDAISRDAGGEGFIQGKPDGARTNGKGGHRGGGKGKDKDKPKKGAHPTPEPSTWMLLGAGLAMVGAYGALRRRGAIAVR